MRYILDKNNSALVCNDNSDNICQRYILYILNKHPSGIKLSILNLKAFETFRFFYFSEY